MREHVRGAIPLTAFAVSDLPFLETGYEDAPQLVDLANHLCKHCLGVLILKMVDRRDAPDLVALPRSPDAGVERTNGVFDCLLKSR